MQRRVTCLLIFSALAAQPAVGQEYTTDRPDGRAPLGVATGYMLETGALTLSYQYGQFRENGLRTGPDEVFPGDLLGEYGVAPTARTTQSHVVSAMYAPSSRVTVIASVPFELRSMEHLTVAGFFYRSTSTGLGDPTVSGLFSLYEEGLYRAHVSATITAPLGSLDAEDVSPSSAPGEERLPYPMQLGTGTLAFSPAVTALAMNEFGSVGAQVGATFRFGENSEGYRHGDRFNLTGWAARNISEYVSLSARLEWQRWGNIEGFDPTFQFQVTTMVTPTIVPGLQGGTRLDLPLGINLFVPDGDLAGHRISIELVLPLDQNLNGPQLADDWSVRVGWQKTIN